MSAKAVEKIRTPFEHARRAGVPIVGLESADPAASIIKCLKALNGTDQQTPSIRWDIVRGPIGLNRIGNTCLAPVIADLPEPEQKDPVAMLAAFVSKADKLVNLVRKSDEDQNPERFPAVIFFVHANRWIEEYQPLQAVWNARDAFEKHGITLVLMGPTIKLPIELKNDVVLISEPLPDHAELGEILDDISDDAGLTAGQIGDRELIVDTMSGTSAFGARQILAMSIRKDGIDGDQLWERKRKMIEQCDGLKIWKGGETFADIGGLDSIKEYLTDILTSGTTPVRAIGFIDEIEKGFAGAAGDTSGTSQDQLQVVLTVMQDFNIPGIIILGHPGTGKSQIAKGAGNVAKAPVIAFDFGAMKDKHVGQSEARVRAAFEVFKAVSQGKGLFIATCNKISSLPPELRRRFKLGTYFADLPTAEEQKLIWPIWIDRFGLKKQTLPECEGWTGAEIAACCEVAFRTGRSLKEAAARVVPVVRSAPEAVESLRKLADNRFLSASHSGLYKMPVVETTAETTGRKIARD